MTRAIFPPVASAEYADKIARAVERGTLKIMPHWLSRAACQSELDCYHAEGALLPLQDRYVPTAAIIRVAGDAGRAAPVPPAKPSCGSGKPYPVSEEDSATSRAAADRRRFNCGALLRPHQQEASDAA